MAPVVAQAASENRDTFAVAKMNVNRNPQTTQKYKAFRHPMYIVFKDGETVKGFAGVLTKNQMVDNILNAINN